mmetsp:Transcript_34438/g.37194  ORF Transcript_34438/g.37194 Transcript_34438/m.37194 type:complete len:299 (-) Transcript_34438:432-1328(-)
MKVPTSKSKVNKKSTSKITISTSAGGGIKHQRVILPKTSSNMGIASSSSVMLSKNYLTSTRPMPMPHPLQSSDSFAATNNSIDNMTYANNKNGKVWYLGGNHVVKLLTSVDGDLDHDVLSKLAAVPTVIGELALSVESLVSDDITVGGFENDILAKIASNTLTAKRGLMVAVAANGFNNKNNTAAPVSSSLPVLTNTTTQAVVNTANTSNAAALTKKSVPVPAIAGQAPNPLLANYQPVPNPLAIRITPPASPSLVDNIITNTNTTTNNCAKLKQDSTSSVCTKSNDMCTDIPMIQAR